MLIAIGHAISHFYQLAFAPLFPVWREVFGLGWTQLGLIMTVFYTVSCIAQAAAGFVVDRYGPRRALIGGLLLMGVGSLLAAAASGYAGLLAAAIVIALGNAVFHPADYALLNTRISERRISHAYSAHAVSGVLGYALAPIVMSALALAYGWRSALVVAALAGIGMAIVVWHCRTAFSIPAAPTSDGPGASAAPGAGPGLFAFMNRALLWCMVFFVTVNIAGIGIQNMGASLLVDLGRMPALTAAGWITAYIVSVGFGMVAGGFAAAGRWRSDVITGAGTTVAAAMMVLIVAFPGLGLFGTGVVLCLAGFALGMVQPARDLLVRSAVSRAAAGRAYGVVYAAVDIGAALGPAVMGWWLDRQSASGGFLTAALFLVLTALTGIMISRAVRRLRQPSPPVTA